MQLEPGADENAFFDKIRQHLNLADFVRVDEVQDAFAKLTESFQKKIKDQSLDFEEGLAALRNQLNMALKDRDLKLDEPLSKAIDGAARYHTELPQPASWTGATLGNTGPSNDDFGSIERQKASTLKYGRSIETEKSLSQ